MTITSLTFILFLAVLFCLYYLIPHKYQWILLFAASLFFYAFAGITGQVYILITALSIFAGSKAMQKISNQNHAYLKAHKEELAKEEKRACKAKAKQKRRIILITVLILNFGLLILFKYSHLIVNTINAIFGSRFGQIDNSFSLLAPLGISYYTLQATGYLVDVYREKVQPQDNFFKVLLYVSFFPQITQGPINDYTKFSASLFAEHTLTYPMFSHGIRRMFWGFFKKMCVADVLSPYVTTVFNGYTQYSGITCVLGAVLYMLQLYADFSGYMDIMCGYCETLGVELAENFNRPFFSKSVSEFWRRWHMTLGVWLKNYVYYPVALSRWNQNLSKKSEKLFGSYFAMNLPATVSLLIVWAFIGLWHNASVAYFLWGLGNAFFIILSMWMEPVTEKISSRLHINSSAFWYRAVQVIRTFIIIVLLEVVAAVENLSGNGFDYLRRMFTEHTVPQGFTGLFPSTSTNNFSMIMFLVAAAGLLLILAVSLTERKRPVRELIDKIPIWIRITALAGGVILIAAFGVEASWEAGAFMYENF